MVGIAERLLAIKRLRHRDPITDAAARPEPTMPPGSDLLPKLRHIVILMMENHSFDNYFAELGRGEVLPRSADGSPVWSNPRTDPAAPPVFAHRLSSTTQVSETPSQSWSASHVQCNAG